MTERGAARVVRLSKETVDALAPAAGRYVVWDADLAGFGVRVEPSGAKTFLYRYRLHGGRRGTLKQMKLGRFGASYTAAQARRDADGRAKEVAASGDPQGAKEAKRAELKMSELCDLYLVEGVDAKKASTLKLDQIRIKRHITPRLGARRVSEITQQDVEQLCRDVASGKIRGEASPHTRGGPGAAARTVGLLAGIFNFAVKRGLRADNPAHGVARPKDKERERYLSPAELDRLGDVLTNLERTGANAAHVAIIRLLLLTGARKNEIARLLWSEVDFELGLLRLGDSKTGQRTIRLGAPAQQLLAGVKRQRSRWVFPDPKYADEPVRNLDWFFVKARTAANLADLRIHDLRHSFASFAIMGGASLPMIGKLLGHRRVQTTARYAHLADDPLRDAADRVSAAVAGGLKVATEKSANSA